jgi:GTP-binding protein
MTATVAIVGRPNVGKSTLFNRLVGKRLAIVEPSPGVTRDWQEGDGKLGDLEFRLLDTPGLEEAPAGTIEAAMRAQAASALSQADLALLVFDARAGVTPLDRHFAAWLRESGVPVIVVANKCESSTGQQGALEGFALGLGDPVMMSAEHAIGLEGLRESLIEAFESIEGALPGEVEPAVDDAISEEDEEEPGGPLRLAVVGRPNVGKSTLVNGLIGSERMVTGPEPGITRDAVPVDWEWKGRPVRLVDTAGLRRRANVTKKLERLSVVETERAIRLAEVVVLVLDATVMAERQDLAIARQVVEEGRALVIAANKWDLVDDPQAALRRLRDRLEKSLPQVKGVATVTISALTGRNLDRLLAAVFAAYETWNRRVATGALNRWMEELVARHPPPAVSGRRLRLRYITQAKARPPTFILFASRPNEIPASYLRYLENGLREAFDLPGVPLRLIPRGGKNPYVAA